MAFLLSQISTIFLCRVMMQCATALIYSLAWFFCDSNDPLEYILCLTEFFIYLDILGIWGNIFDDYGVAITKRT